MDLLDFDAIIQQAGGTPAPASPAVADPTTPQAVEPAPVEAPAEPAAEPAPTSAPTTASVEASADQPLDFDAIVASTEAPPASTEAPPASNAQPSAASAPTAESEIPSALGGLLKAPPDRGHASGIEAVVEKAKHNPLFWLDPFGTILTYAKARGVEVDPIAPVKTVASGIWDAMEANRRGIENNYPAGPEGEKQRNDDALAASLGMLTGGAPGKIAKPAVAAKSAEATALDEALEAAKRIGVTIPRGAASGKSVGTVAAQIKELPIVGTPLVKAGRAATEGMESTVAGVADDLGRATPESAGHTVKRDLSDWLGDGSTEEARAIYRPLEQAFGDDRVMPYNTAHAVVELSQRAEEAFLENPAVVNTIRNALNLSVAEDGMTFQGLQTMREEIGKRIAGIITAEPGMDKEALRTLYAGLTKDLEDLAGPVGTPRRQAWEAANAQFKQQVQSRRDLIADLIGKDAAATPEAVTESLIRMAGSKAGADITTMRAVRETVGRQAWNDLGAAVISRLGQDKNGFSLAKFRTDYTRLSDDAKNILFSPAHKRALDDVFTVGRKFEDLEKLGNPSRSGVYGTVMAFTAYLMHDPFLAVGTLVGGRAVAKLMAGPKGAGALAAWADATKAVTTKPTAAAFKALSDATRALNQAAVDAGLPSDTFVRAGLMAANAAGDNTNPLGVRETVSAEAPSTTVVDAGPTSTVKATDATAPAERESHLYRPSDRQSANVQDMRPAPEFEAFDDDQLVERYNSYWKNGKRTEDGLAAQKEILLEMYRRNMIDLTDRSAAAR